MNARLRRILSLSVSILLILSACKSYGPEGPKDGGSGTKYSSTTIGMEQLSAVGAVLKGKASVGSTVASDLKMGMMWSVSSGVLPSNSTKVEATNMDRDYNYSVGITGLDPETTYYYRSYITQNGQDNYGETKQFTTKALSSLLLTRDATAVESRGAVLNAMLDLTDVLYQTVEYGFYWGSSENSQTGELIGGSIAENAYSAPLPGLAPKTQYWYKSFVKLDNRTLFGEIKTFKTDIIPVSSVSLNPEKHTFKTIGDSKTLTATILPRDATNKGLEWTSSNKKVATVSSDGVVKAIGNGTATITVKTQDQGKTATCAITVAQTVTEITLNKDKLSLHEGKTETLTAKISPSNANNKTLTWRSSDTKIATVDKNGKVAAVSKGKATITATATDGSKVSATCDVEVIRPITSIVPDKTSIIISTNQTESITAKVTPSTASNKNLIWSSSNPSVVAIYNTSGSSAWIQGKAVGTATITAKANDGSGVSASCIVLVLDLSLNKTSLSLVEGESFKLTATVSSGNAGNTALTWSSSNASVASVDNTGRVVGLSKGKATITASVKDGSRVFANCDVIVSHACPAGAVDLGFTTKDGYKLYWATCNLGASSPEERGDYYAWGETSPRSTYNWAAYKWCRGSASALTKYCPSGMSDFWYGSDFPDNKTVLDLADDAAHANLGGNWRMPTVSECLYLYARVTWTTLYGKEGVKIMSPIEGYTDRWIFIPAAGYKSGSSLIRYGSCAGFWTSILETDSPTKAGVFLRQNNSSNEAYDSSRCDGFPIRPVYD